MARPLTAKRVASMKVERTEVLGSKASKEVKTTAMFELGIGNWKGT